MNINTQLADAVPIGWMHQPIKTITDVTDAFTKISTIDGTAAGKTIHINSDAQAVKQAAANKSEYTALTLHADDFTETLDGLFDTNALILGAVPGMAIGDQYTILSLAELNRRLGRPKGTRSLGVYIDPNGRRYTARFKENFQYSTIRMFDRDPHEAQAEHWRELDPWEWWEALVCLEPSLTGVKAIMQPSSSNRVVDLDGRLVMPSGAQHFFVRMTLDSPSPDEGAIAMKVRAILSGAGWEKPIHSRQTGGLITSIWSPPWDHAAMLGSQRLVFDGPPRLVGDAANKLCVTECCVMTNSAGGRWDLSSLRGLTRHEELRYQALTGTKLTRVGTGSACERSEVIHTLELGTVVTTEYGDMSLREFWGSDYQHVRAQADWRGSTSWNAFFGRMSDGTPFLYDNGTRIRMMPSTLAIAVMDRLHAQVEFNATLERLRHE